MDYHHHARIAFSAIYPNEKQASALAVLAAARAYDAPDRHPLQSDPDRQRPAYRSHAFSVAGKQRGLAPAFGGCFAEIVLYLRRQDALIIKGGEVRSPVATRLNYEQAYKGHLTNKIYPAVEHPRQDVPCWQRHECHTDNH